MNDFFKSISDFIFVESEISKSDVILIPGGSHIELAEKASELYHKGMASYILPSGGKNKKLINYNTEWDFLNEKLLEMGVPQKAILKENKALNTFENAKFSKNVLKAKKLKANKLIIVCKNFHSRRVLLTYSLIFQIENQILVSPITDNRNIRKENWFSDVTKRKRVLAEIEKIGVYFEQWYNKLN